MANINLTTTWLAARADARGEGRAAALRYLNARTRRNYTLSRLGEWVKGTREPDRPCRMVMLEDCLRYEFAGLVPYERDNPSDWADLAEALT